MMSPSYRLVEKDPRKEAAERNPCNLCRAVGLPGCKGHSGGGGGTSSDSKKDSGSASVSSGPIQASDIKAQLALSMYWTKNVVLNSVLEYKNPAAVLGFCLDMDRCLVAFYGNKKLSKEEELIVEEFLDAIEDELNLFKEELLKQGISQELVEQIKMKYVDTSLVLKFPTPKLHEGFIQRLVEKNLLSVVPGVQNENELDSPAEAGLEKHIAPNPFDIRSGPKPKRSLID
jgi:hypothetical protein